MKQQIRKHVQSWPGFAMCLTYLARALIPLALTLCLLVTVALVGRSRPAQPNHADLPTGLHGLLRAEGAKLTAIRIERLNLLCAEGLPGITASPDASEQAVDTWSARVSSETERHLYRFRENPGEFENSEGYFRMLMLTVVLAEDYGIHYDSRLRTEPHRASMDDGFFREPSSVFLEGLLGPERKGTCSSLPVLYAAVGRRLGYPLRLVTTRGHLFLRWDGPNERFNIEATARGLSRMEDDYYREWPYPLAPGEEEAEGYLKSLAPAEELAVFLSIRGMCLRELGRSPDAAQAFEAAARLNPGCRSYQQVAARLRGPLPTSAPSRPRARSEMNL